MASPDGTQTIDLIQQIEANPYGYDFFRVVRLLDAYFADRPRIGESITPRDDTIRFRQNPSLAFAPSTLEALLPGAEHKPDLFVNFLGLCGPNGPLPLHVTEYAHERMQNEHDQTMARFFDVFHQRILSLFYRAWVVNQKAADLDRPDEARYPVYIGSLFGIGMESLRNRDEIPDWAKLHYSGRLISQTRNAEGLGAILEDYLCVPTTIETFCGHWMNLPENSVFRLGASPETGRLGVNLIVGSRVWECQLKFRIRFGPMKLADFHRLLPGSSAYRKLREWIKNYSPFQYFWDVQLILQKDEVPDTRLGESGMLGWTTWMKSQPFERDAEDLILNPESN
jgi:type VI secretion system protein ImpH